MLSSALSQPGEQERRLADAGQCRQVLTQSCSEDSHRLVLYFISVCRKCFHILYPTCCLFLFIILIFFFHVYARTELTEIKDT